MATSRVVDAGRSSFARARRGGLLLAVALVVVASGGAAAASGTRGPPPSTYPVLAPGLQSRLLTNLTVAPVGSGGSSPLAFDFQDSLGRAIANVTLQFEIYAFDAYPGNATGPLPLGDAPELVAGGSAGWDVNFTWSLVTPGGGTGPSATVVVPSAAAAGDYAIRTSLRFDTNGTSYLLESRGYFSAAAWSYATNGASAPNGTPELNVSRLNVSGVLPETALLVTPPSPNFAIYGLLGASAAAAGAGAFYWFRGGGPGSRSGARSTPGASSAESAFGNSRTSDGD